MNFFVKICLLNIEERRSRRKNIDEDHLYVKDPETVNSIFFAQQMVPNSCATHALVSILLNCPDQNLGPALTQLKDHVEGTDSETKGLAIGNWYLHCFQLHKS